MKIFVLCLFILYLPIVSGCRPAAAPVSVSTKPISINNVPQTNLPMPPSKPLEEMSWTTLDGKRQTLGELKGKVVLLDFWATYCPPCIKAIPNLNQMQTKYGADTMQIVGLNVGGEEDAPKVPAFAEKFQINYILATPENALTSFIFGQETAIPQTAIFNRKGEFVEKFIGFDDKIQVKLDAAIERVVNSGE